jgi:hypothetical protein
VGVYEAGSPDGAVYEALSAEFSAALEAVVEREQRAERQARRERLIDRIASVWSGLDESALGEQGEELGETLRNLIQTRQEIDTIRVHDEGPPSEASPETQRDATKKPRAG